MALHALSTPGTGIGDPVAKSEAFFGLPGRIVAAIDPHTEAHAMAILSNTMVMFGNVIGRGPYFPVEYTKHHTNLNIGQTGKTSKGRKGTGNSTPKHMIGEVDPNWAKTCVKSGLSSGEGLIYNIRDDRIVMGNLVPGVTDKRLMLVEEEFAQALKVMTREGNILSPILRDAWDGKDLQPLTRSELAPV